jgi:hypothetical protein
VKQLVMSEDLPRHVVVPDTEEHDNRATDRVSIPVNVRSKSTLDRGRRNVSREGRWQGAHHLSGAKQAALRVEHKAAFGPRDPFNSTSSFQLPAQCAIVIRERIPKASHPILWPSEPRAADRDSQGRVD